MAEATTSSSLAEWRCEDLGDHLRRRGVELGTSVTCTTLSGGVSGTVLRADGSDGSVVVKQALSQLAVSGAWEADPRRLLTEAAALRVFHTMTPERAPEVMDCDEDHLVLAMAAAPSGWSTWKEALLRGQQPEHAARLAAEVGSVLRRWHDATQETTWSATLPVERERFAATKTFRDLRVDPFYRAVGTDIGGPVRTRLFELADELLTQPRCLVHGDLSPKNILTPPVADGQWWVVDSEVAVLSDPVFDVAFVLSHLLLKSLAPTRPHLIAVAEHLWESYCGDDRPIREDRLVAHVAALMLARVAGVSPVNYLTTDQQRDVRRFGITVLSSSVTQLPELMTLLPRNETQP